MRNLRLFKRIGDNIELFDLLILTIVVLFFHLCYGLQIIDPTNINWIMSVYHDWGQHYLGWAFYRNDPWSYPLGAIESYNYPVGSNIGFMDSIPLLALLFKPFRSILPHDFQYLGLWLFVCSYFIAFYTKKIFKLYKVSNWIIILAILILISNPVLLFRSIHPALSAHFLILGSIYNYLRPSYAIANKINKHQIILFFIAATVNPYIVVMIFGFNTIVPLKHYLIDKTISLNKAFLYPVLSVVLFVLFWIIIGMIEFNNGTSVASVEPFSAYSFNLNSFFDSYGYYSKFIPDLGRIDPRQYEGFAYMGIGLLILILISTTTTIFFLIKRKIDLNMVKKFGLLLLLCFFLMLFAITNVVSLNSEILVTFPLPRVIEKLGFIFRASGRFIWPLYYLLVMGSILIFIKIKINSYLKITILSFITLIQLYDTQELFTRWNLPSGSYQTPLEDDKWIAVMKNFGDIIIYPSFDYNYSINYHNDYQDLSYLALKSGKPISNGYVARANVVKAQEFLSKLQMELSSGTIDDNRLFLTTKRHIDAFGVLIKNQTVDIHMMDDFIFIYKKNTNLRSANFKEKSQTKVYLDSVKTYYKNHKTDELELSSVKLSSDIVIKYYFDSFVFENNAIKTRGWAFLENSDNNEKDTIFLLLSKNNDNYLIKLKEEIRTDITTAFKKSNLDNSGFNSVVFTNSLAKGTYSVGLVIKNKSDENISILSDKKITVK